MTQREKMGFIIGMVLGDSSIDHNGSMNLTHSIKQKEYFLHKKVLLENEIDAKQIPYRAWRLSGHVLNGSECNGELLQFRSHRHRLYRYARAIMYFEGKKRVTPRALRYLTPLGIALWFMDDGSTSYKYSNRYLSNGGQKISSVELTLNTYISVEENQFIIDYFREMWGVRFGLNKSHDKWRLRCGTKEGRKFAKIIEPYIIPQMRYKVEKLLTQCSPSLISKDEEIVHS